MPGGRPAKFKTPEELQEKIDEYFEGGMRTRKIVTGPANNRQVQEIQVPTITGLALFLGFCDRHSMYDYEKRPAFSHTIKRARAFIELEYEELLREGNVTGAIFALKNFGWRDQQQHEHTGNLTLGLLNEIQSTKDQIVGTSDE